MNDYLTTAERGLIAEATYTDDVIAVMRSTIEAQRVTIAAKDQVIAGLRAHLEESILNFEYWRNRTLEEGAQLMALAKAILAADRAKRAERKEPA
jgi:hypothetical protein